MSAESKWDGIVALGRPAEGDPRKFTTVSFLTFDSKHGKVTVLPGFKTDGASVPRAFWWYAAPLTGRHAAAALVHDALYRSHLMPKEEADEVFYEGMLNLGVRKTKAWLMYQSVRQFGGRPWNKGEPDATYVRVRIMK